MVEPQIVVLAVAGSSPVGHPNLSSVSAVISDSIAVSLLRCDPLWVVREKPVPARAPPISGIAQFTVTWQSGFLSKTSVRDLK
jgi:hypothetical protein